jgi:glutamate-5-semialdehyde dehydrogenase
MMQDVENKVLDLAAKAKVASSFLAEMSAESRREALLAVADGLSKQQSKIFEANEADLKHAKHMVEAGDLSEAAYNRLKLDDSKMRSLLDGIEQIASFEDPLGKVQLKRKLDDGLVLSRITAPIGVIGVIFESRPDVLPQIVALCLKSGNAVILKGGSEAEKSNRALFDCIQLAIGSVGIHSDSLALLSGRKDVELLLKADRYVDLIVPRGSNQLVAYIQANTRIPVLGHADGVCHLYVDKEADLDMATSICIDAKTQYPAACNSIETLLVHRDISSTFLPDLSTKLDKLGVKIRSDSQFAETKSTEIVVDQDLDWTTEYSDKILSVRIVNSSDDAINHINEFGSNHTDAIITRNEQTFEQFFNRVNSAGIYWNASTRFADGFRYGFGAEVGISTGRMHPRGPVGIEGLVTYKYKLEGNGHVVADYVGDKARKFLHEDI